MGGVTGAAGARSASSQRPPTDRVDRAFPAEAVPVGTLLVRAVGPDASGGGPRGFGWFASDDDGRFNLEPPRGTCYLAASACAAAWEVCGPQLASVPAVHAAFAHRTWLWTVATTAGLRLARLRGPGANARGVTGELDQGAFPSYAIPRAWAARFDAVGFDGIVYQARHATACEEPGAVAVFGPSGAHDGPFRASGPPVRLSTIAAGLGIRVAPPVSLADPPDVSPIR